MTRLTERNKNGGITVRDMTAALEKLAEYEDAEEQGRLVRLPVKIGQKVDITFRRGQDEFFHCEYGGANWRVTYMTREEAEAALKGGGV